MKNFIFALMAMVFLCIFAPVSHAADNPTANTEYIVFNNTPDVPVVSDLYFDYFAPVPDPGGVVPLLSNKNIISNVFILSVFKPPVTISQRGIQNKYKYTNSNNYPGLYTWQHLKSHIPLNRI